LAGGGGGSMREYGVDHVAWASSSSPFRASAVMVAATLKTTTQLRQFLGLV
jgi:hypothetical protein